MNPQEQRWFTLPLESINHPRARNDIDNHEIILQFNSLLRGEIAASETYRMAIDKLIKDGRGPAQIGMLHEIQREHIRAAQVFRKRIAELGGISEESSGTWGKWAKVAMGAAQLFGDRATLHALRDGEEQGLKEMQSAIQNIDANSAELLEKAMIPAQARHIRRITSLIHVIAA